MFLSRNSLPDETSSWGQPCEKVEPKAKPKIRLRKAHQELAYKIIENIQLKKSLPPAEEMYQNIFENAVEGIFQITVDGKCLNANRALAKIYGYSSAEELINNITDIGKLYVDRHRREHFLSLVETQDRVCGFESEISCSDGRIIWISENVRTVRDRTGKVLYYEGFVTDITERKLSEVTLQQFVSEAKKQAQQLELTLEQLKRTQALLIQSEKMSSLGQMLAGVAHEINNPVNFVCGNLIHASQYVDDLVTLLELYQQYYPNPVPQVQEKAEEIEADFLIEDFPKTMSSMQIGAERIRQIVQSLRNFSRLDEEQMKPIDLHQGIDSTLLILNNRIKPTGTNPGINIVKEYGNLPAVECLGGLINQVFMNLVSNAIDAFEEYDETRSPIELRKNPSTIYIRTEFIDFNLSDNSTLDILTSDAQIPKQEPTVPLASKYVAIRIRDNGPGIPQEVRDRIFDPFFTTKPVGKGTGLGLSISHQIVVEKHGGQLKCVSTPGQGTEFVVKIPVKHFSEVQSVS